ncbi:MAG: hypothetical protein ACTSRA_02575 [Promethearchaeota archaeon]
MDLSGLVKKALLEFGPCSVRDLFDYMRSDFALKRGLYIFKDFSIDILYKTLNKLVEKNELIVKFSCSSGTKVRYGYTNLPGCLPGEPRYLEPIGNLECCSFCGSPVFIYNGNKFHLHADCFKYSRQKTFIILRYNNTKAIISDSFVFGVIDGKMDYRIRLPGIINKPPEITSKLRFGVFSELWYINELAREKGLVPPGRLLPLKVKETL